MRKLLWLFILFVAATATREALDYFGPMAAAFRTYRDGASAQVLERGKTKSFRDIEGHLVHVSYELESAERKSDDEVRLVVLEAVHFRKGSEMMAFGNRRVAQTRQYVVMTRTGSEWIVSHIELDATKVVDLADVAEAVRD